MNVGVTADSRDYAVRGPILLRLAPWDPKGIPAVPDVDPAADPDAVAGFVRACAEDPVFAEALALASPPTARAAAAFVHDGSSTQDALRLALTLSRYAARMSARATPFGLFAGVALAEPDSRLELTLGPGHRKAVRPDSGRLTALARSLETAPDVLPRLRIAVNPHCRVRGSRLVLPTPSSGDLGQGGTLRPASVRRNPAVDELLRLCRTPLPAVEIVAGLRATFPQLTDEAAGRLLGSLLARGFLVSDLRPPVHVADPTTWLRERVPSAGLDLLDAAVSVYRELPVGEGSPALQGIRTAMRAPDDDTVAPQVDLAVDAGASVPRAVLAEIERAAAVMWRVSPGRVLFSELRRFHTAFVERYGMGRAVPIGEVLDPLTGLDAPPGYHHPRSTRRVGEAPASPAFVAAMGAAVQQAMLRGNTEIELTPELLDALDEDPDSPLWTSFDVTVQVLGEPPGEDFTLVCSPTGLTRRAGQVLGRFSRLLGITGELRELFAAEAGTGPRPVQLEYRPREDRMLNVVQVPRLLPEVATVDHDETGGIGLGEIGLCADAEGLYAVSLRDGTEIEACALHMANPARYAPNAARLLTELELLSTRGASPWQWRELDELPWLPRIRTGRTILQAARWRTEELRPAVESDVDWTTAVEEWRSRWRVPARVVLSQTQQLPLRLDRAWDLRVFRHELQRRPDTVVCEDLTPPESRGWTGGRACEITAMVFADPERRRASREPVALTSQPVETHGFGGEWLYLKLFCDPQSWDTTVAEALGELADRLPDEVDRWHWLRYPEPSAHVRLRLHAEPEALYGAVIPILREWTGRARAAGLLGAIEAAEYEPEPRRYGSGAALVAAEEFFGADGAVVLAQLRTQTAAALKAAPDVLAALNFLRILHDLGAETGRAWLLSHVAAESRRGLDRSARRRAGELTDFAGDFPLPRTDALPLAVTAAWDARTVALRRYIAALDADPDAPDRDGIVASLLHMHFNRHAGPDRPAEHRALSLAREIMHAHEARRRHR